MAKFYGAIGYGESVESPPGSGVYKDVITERSYFGDIVRNTRQLRDGGDSLNNDIVVSNSISVVADAYASGHIFAIRYVKWMGACWKVEDVDATQPPSLILRLGEVYNGPTAA